MKSIFAIVCSSSPDLHHTKFFSTKEAAQKRLKELAKERKYKLGVNFIEENDNSFTYLLGWEEHRVRFSIIELQVEKS